MAYHHKSIAVVIPAYNEEGSIAKVVRDFIALREFPGTNSGELLIDDIVVCDNASTDDTASQAFNAGARVIYEATPGYGSACLAGIDVLKTPDIIVFVDGDHSVVATETISLLEEIVKNDADLVIGSRVSSKREKRALTMPQRIGNILASFVIRLIWRQPVSDLGPFRAIKFSSLRKLQMNDKKFGWTVEMQVKAIQHSMKVVEVPVSTLKRIGRSKISGTVKGTFGAATGIFGKIYCLYKKEKANKLDSIELNAAKINSKSQ
jgi:glycosyltransferase involved in cell wall biosynthesis